MGFTKLRSELDTFPINPSLDTVENCRRIVERDADILVLVIGGRYGYVPDEVGCSVTNLEYLTARSKKIPIYVFIDREVLNLLPIYAKTPEVSFSPVIENNRVLDFVRTVRDEHKVWTFPFDRAQDIASALKSQLAISFGESLRLIAALESKRNGWMRQLSASAFRIAFENPPAWEYRLFAQALTDEIDEQYIAREQHRLGIAFGVSPVSNLYEFVNFAAVKNEEARKFLENFNTLFSDALPQALGPEGLPGDARQIAFIAVQVAGIYKRCLEWSQQVRLAAVIEDAAETTEAMARFVDAIIEPIEEYGPYCLREIERGLRDGTTESPVLLELTLRLKEPDIEPVLKGLDGIKAKLGV